MSATETAALVACEVEEVDTPTPRFRSGRPAKDLSTVEGVSAELADLYRQARRGKIDATRAAKLGYLLGLLLRAVEVAQIERRLDAIEAATLGDQHGNTEH